MGVIIILAAAGLTAKYYWLRGPFRFAGTLEATKVDLSSRLSSVIQDVSVKEGEHVKPEQIVLSLACDDLKVSSAWANENYNRTLRLFKAGSAPKEAMDDAKTKKDDADVKLSWCVLRSPISGTVLSRYHEPGEWVNPGTKILTLANVGDIWAYIYVPQPDVSKLKPGMRLTGILPELNNREFDGKILKINDEAEFTPKNVQTRSERTRLVYGVKISFLEANREEILKPGMTIEVELPSE